MAKRIIQCVSDLEPALFSREDGKRYISVRLSCSASGLDLETSKKWYEEYLTNYLAKLKEIKIFSWGNTGWSELGTFEVTSQPEKVLVEEFQIWLKKYGKSEGEQFYKDTAVASIDTKSHEKVVEDSEINATHLISAAACWLAPIPQKLGISHRVEIDQDQIHEPIKYIVVPVFNGASEPATADFPRLENGQDTVELAYKNDEGQNPEMLFLRTELCQVMPDKSYSKVNIDTGFVKVGADQAAEKKYYEQYNSVLQKSGSLFTGYFIVQNLIEPLSDPINLDTLLPRYGWLLLNSIATSLDTLYIALLTPGFPGRFGDVLASFINILTLKTYKKIDQQESLGIDDLRNNLLMAVREEIKRRATKEAVDLQDSSLYRKLTNIDDLDGFSDNQQKWIVLLCKCFRINGAGSLVDLNKLAKKVVKEGASLKNTLIKICNSLQDTVQSERGIEHALYIVLSHDKKEYIKKIKNNIPELTDIIDEKIYEEILADFKSDLDSGFNGLEACRSTVGAVLADLAVKNNNGNLEQGIKSIKFWTSRFPFVDDGQDQGTAAGIIDAFVLPTAKLNVYFDGDSYALTAIENEITAYEENSLSQIFPNENDRFIPDQAPRPLKIRINVDPSIADDMIDFETIFAGMSVLISKQIEGGQDGRWAYANLCELVNPPAPDQTADLADPFKYFTGQTIQPLPTTVIDGRRNLFLSYHGTPFSTSAYDESLPQGSGDVESKDLFFGTDYPEASAYTKLPRLCYGAKFEIASHVVARSGALPWNLQGNDYWKPENDVTKDKVPVDCKMSTTYSRTTAIGRTTIVGKGDSKQLGVIPDGVFPLAADYPKLVFSSDMNKFLDLFRNTNGRGAIELPMEVGKPTVIVLKNVRFFPNSNDEGDGNCNVVVSFLSKANISIEDPTEVAITVTEVRSEPTDIHISIALIEDGGRKYSVSVKINGDQQELGNIDLGESSVWVRLGFSSGKGVISLDDTLADLSGKAGESRKTPENILLLGTSSPGGNGKTIWKDTIQSKAKLKLRIPRMSFEDFTRWIENDTCRNAIFPDGNEDLIKKFRYLLQAAHIGRMDKESELEIAALLEQMPDFSVSKIRLEVVPVDHLGVSRGVIPNYIDIGMPSLEELANDNKIKKLIDENKIGALLDEIDKHFEIDITLDAGARKLTIHGVGDFDIGINDNETNLAGNLFRISAYPVVKKEHFSGNYSLLDKRLKQWAIGRDNDDIVFDGAHVLVEVMQGLEDESSWADKMFELCQHKPVGGAREYSLNMEPEDAIWRNVGSIVVETQEWIFRGHPIYSWVNPRDYCDNTDAVKKDFTQSSFKIGFDSENSNTEKYEKFETQLFWGRDEDDSLSTEVKLNPLNTETVIAKVDQNRSTATLYRHRFTVWSRYAAAMKNPMKRAGMRLGWDSEVFTKSWFRVVMLADAERIGVTRPQLRGIVPLTRSVGKDKTPPLMAYVSETPFVHAGLAERVVSGIQTGIGYGNVSTEGSNPKVGPVDARKEIGPDGRLSYSHIEASEAQNLVASQEGPIGLTFDESNSAAPAFANYAMLMEPRALDSDATKSFEEQFLSVSLRRYLDPNWCVDPVVNQDVGSGIDFRRSRLIRVEVKQPEQEQTEQELIFELKKGKDESNSKINLLKIRIHNSTCEISFDCRGIDSEIDKSITGDDDSNPLILGSIKTSEIENIQILHIPKDQKTASLCVLVEPTSVNISHSGNGPILIASVEWSVPDGFKPELVCENPGHHSLKICATSASNATGLNWARTNKDFDRVKVKLNNEVLEKPVDEIQVIKDKDNNILAKSGGTDCWVLSNSEKPNYTTHTQRHLALIISESITGVGKPLDYPVCVQLLIGMKTPISSEYKNHKLENIRFLEFETPAQIVGCVHGAVIPERYEKAYFDFKAIGFNNVFKGESSEWNLSFKFRLVGSEEARKKNIVLKFKFKKDSDKEIEVELKHTEQPKLATKEIILDIKSSANGSTIDISGKYLNDSGDLDDCTLNSVDFGGLLGSDVTGLYITPEVDSKSELWFEIGMLCSNKTNANQYGFLGQLDFDWMFGAGEVSEENMATHAGLSQMAEAQARVISVSSPIKLDLESS